jgi:hypothetical protein
MLGVATVTLESIMRFVCHNIVGALRWDKCRSYGCDHQEDIRQHGCPFSIGSHGVLCCVTFCVYSRQLGSSHFSS